MLIPQCQHTHLRVRASYLFAVHSVIFIHVIAFVMLHMWSFLPLALSVLFHGLQKIDVSPIFRENGPQSAREWVPLRLQVQISIERAMSLLHSEKNPCHSLVRHICPCLGIPSLGTRDPRTTGSCDTGIYRSEIFSPICRRSPRCVNLWEEKNSLSSRSKWSFVNTNQENQKTFECSEINLNNVSGKFFRHWSSVTRRPLSQSNFFIDCLTDKNMLFRKCKYATRGIGVITFTLTMWVSSLFMSI